MTIHPLCSSIMNTLVSLPNSAAHFLFPLRHAHIQFGHWYEQQENWVLYPSRLASGGEALCDIECLTRASEWQQSNTTLAMPAPRSLCFLGLTNWCTQKLLSHLSPGHCS